MCCWERWIWVAKPDEVFPPETSCLLYEDACIGCVSRRINACLLRRDVEEQKEQMFRYGEK